MILYYGLYFLQKKKHFRGDPFIGRAPHRAPFHTQFFQKTNFRGPWWSNGLTRYHYDEAMPSVGGSNPRLSLSFIRQSLVARRNVRPRSRPKKKRVRQKQRRERQIEEERPAGVSGMVTRKAFGSFRKKKTIKW